LIFIYKFPGDNKTDRSTAPDNVENAKMSEAKISIRFFDDREVRAVWDQENARWLVSLPS
jgi:hypothetical protein